MARTWNLTLTPADGNHEVVRGLSDDEMARMLSSLVSGGGLEVPAVRPAQAGDRETREPVAA